MIIQIKVKRGITELAEIKGVEIQTKDLTISDMTKIPEVEQFLERLTGYRFHIDLVITPERGYGTTADK